MPQQGQYPINGRVVNLSDIVTGTAQGTTADIPVATLAAACASGTTVNRPIPLYIGHPYFDLTLGFMVWAKQISPPIWVAASGVQV